MLSKCLNVLGILLIVAAWFSVAYYWDATRVYVKRFKAEDSYVYDDLRPEHLNADVSANLSIDDNDAAQEARRRLVQVIWGQSELPRDLFPHKVRKNLLRYKPLTDDCAELECKENETLQRLKCQLGRYENWPKLAGIDELLVNVGPVYTASMAYFRPKTPNGTLVIYQNGYASTYHHQYRHIERLINRGFTVIAANHVGYGDNYCPLNSDASAWCDIGWGRFDKPLPMRIHFSPLVAAINYGKKESEFKQVAMLGLSAGGWLTSVMAAVDPRIDFSYPVAGFMPPFLQENGELPPNQTYKPLFEAASMLDQFILAADQPGRRQIQYFNRYDRCCYANTRALIYLPEINSRIQAVNGGAFDVRIDVSHARHKISRWAIEAIIDDILEHSGT